MRSLFIVFIVCLVSQVAFSQDPNLANQYFANGEYEKAAVLFEKIYEKDPRNDYYFNRYVDCLVLLERYADAETTIQAQIKKDKSNPQLYFMYGDLHERQGKMEQADEQYKKAIGLMAPDFNSVIRLASAFTNKGKYDYAVIAYEKGGEMMKDRNRFALNLGELYRRTGNSAKMIENYLNTLDSDPGRLPTVITYLSRYLAPEDFPELQGQLYARIQQSDNPDFIELLAWSFMQKKDFKSALRQIKALDKRLGENGRRVFELGDDAAQNKDYDTAIAAFEYIMEEKGPSNPYFFEAKREAMNARSKKITEGYDYSEEDLRLLEKEYESFLDQYGVGKQTASIVIELADLEAFYINDLDKSVRLLNALLESPGINPQVLARVKINLADFYLMQGEIWESTLLYSQVDKALKEEQIAQEARFKNAKLSYFNGDFQWAQAQCDVLKASTSKLISNDALDLSVFIMDNLNLDTTSAAISLYSGAELLVFQNRFAEAFQKLDSLKNNFPDHSLQDDILYLEAQIHEKKREWEKAAALYQQIAEKFPEDIRADNALYALAQLNETKLNDQEKAKALYEKIFLEYSGSVFAVEARKRYRILRGDELQ